MDFSAERAVWIIEHRLGVSIWHLQVFSSGGYVEDKIFCHPLNTMDELKLRITEVINAIEPQTLGKVVCSDVNFWKFRDRF